MRRTLSLGLVLATFVATGVAACSSTPPATPAPTVETPTWDPRKDQIDTAAAIWDRQRPPAYAYTLSNDGTSPERPGWRYHVSGLEGDEQVQRLFAQSGLVANLAPEELGVDGLFATARAALASEAFTFAYDPLRGYPTKLVFASAADPSAGGSTETLDDFTTAATVGAANTARTGMDEVLRRSRATSDGTWEYTWSRIPAGSPDAQPTVWTVRHDRKGTTAKQASEGDAPVTQDDVSIDATALAITNVLGSGGWVDVAVEDAPGLGVLIAVDPSPSVKGDAYWIRIAWTDLALRAAITDTQAAKARWATAQLTDYTYTWRFEGDRPLAYKVSRKGEAATVTPQGATPVPEAVAYAVPRIEDTFALIQAVLDQGGTVKATYDEQLGYPKRVELVPNGDAGAKGVITIANLKRH